MIENVGSVRAWHGVIAALVAAAFVTQLVLVLDDGRSVVNLVSYFTIQSNLLMMVGAALVARDPSDTRTWVQLVRLAGLVGITVTGIVYATVLAGAIPLEGIRLVLDIVFHYVVPWASVAGFVLLRPRTRFDAVAWWFLAWPIAWLVYTLVRAEVAEPVYPLGATATGPVPYGFLDIDENGVASVVVACVVVTLLAVALAAGYRWISRRPAR